MNDKTILATLAVVGAAFGNAVSAQPERQATERPQAVWTPSVQAPEGTLTHALEELRHDLFIELAQKGDIDLVFFGTTETEMWSWPERGRAVWDRELAGRKAANFGSQGTTPKSLLWRMQNGELDGYEAKLVVLQLGAGGRIADPFSPGRETEFVAASASIIAEIRARQPQAKILLTAPVPRGIPPRDSRQSWQEIADANAPVLAQLTDDETVFYADFGERFFLSDGSYDHDYWGMPGPAGVGIQPPAYEVLAEELEPWVDRFVR
jgi:lysophospholipase L1-like esterase